MTRRRRLIHTAFLFLLPLIVAVFGMSVFTAALLVVAMLLWRWMIVLSGIVAPEKGPEIELETIGISHFVEKVRWCLDRLGVDLHLSANALDGEWTNPVCWDPPDPPTGGDTYPSGDGNPGGDFQFDINVLPSDSNQDGEVDFHDVLGFRPRLFFVDGVDLAAGEDEIGFFGRVDNRAALNCVGSCRFDAR